MNNKVAIYCRLSEEDRNKKNKTDDSSSIQSQKLMLTEYAFDHHWEIFDIYSDEDYAGSDRNRPEFNRMIADAMAKKFNIVLCKTQSRFTRELEIVEKYIHYIFPELGIRFVSVVDNIDTNIAGNKKARQINGLINEWYLEDMSDSIKSALRTRMKAGYFIGSFPPYGYKKDPEVKGHLIIDEETAWVIQEIFDLYVQGTGRSKIAKILNEKGIPSPAQYYKLKGFKTREYRNKNMMFWKYYTVSHILQNEVYIGNLVQSQTYNPTYKSKHSIPNDKENWIRVENTHEAIIDKETWDLTREIWNSKTHPCYVTEKPNPFSGILVCAKCGYKMTTGYNKKRRYYRCSSAKFSKTLCEGTTVFESTVKKAVLQEMEQLRQEYCDESYVIKKASVLDKRRQETDSLEQQIKTLQKQTEEIESYIKSLYVDKLKGLLDENQFTELYRQFNNEKKDFEKQINALSLRLSQLFKIKAGDIDKVKVIREMLSFNEIDRSFVNHFIEHIEIDGTKANRVINVYWKF